MAANVPACRPPGRGRHTVPVPDRPRRSAARPLATLVAVVLAAAACSSGGVDVGDGPADPPGPPTTSTSLDVGEVPDLPVVGGTDDDGQPLPPPVHAGVSIVVAGPATWWPYADPDRDDVRADDLGSLTSALARVSSVLAQLDVPATFHLSSGVAAALCERDPGVLDAVERAGHGLGGWADTPADLFAVRDDLAACGRGLGPVAGLDRLARRSDGTLLPELLTDSLNVLALLGATEVVGAVSAPCLELGLAEPTHAYGTGALTAPWRSAWAVGQPCADAADGRLVLVDHTPFAPLGAAAGGSDDELDPAAADALAGRADQVLGYAADLRYRSPEELPAPGLVTWGVTARLDQLAPLWSPVPPPEAEAETGDEAEAGDDDPTTSSTAPDTTTTTEAPAEEGEGTDDDSEPPFDPVLALAEVLGALRPAVDEGRLVWVRPEWVGAALRGT